MSPRAAPAQTRRANGADRERVAARNRTALDDGRQVVTLNQLHGERRRSLQEPVNRRDIRMIQRAQRLRLALEPGQPVGIGSERRRQDFEGDVG